MHECLTVGVAQFQLPLMVSSVPLRVHVQLPVVPEVAARAGNGGSKLKISTAARINDKNLFITIPSVFVFLYTYIHCTTPPCLRQYLSSLKIQIF